MTAILAAILLFIFMGFFLAAQSLPDIPPEVFLSIGTIFAQLKALNNYIPITEILALFWFVLGLEIIMWGIRLAFVIRDMIYGNSARFDNRRNP